MRSTTIRRLAATVLTAGLGVSAALAGNLDQLNYFDVSGSRVSDLRDNPNNAAIFPNNPGFQPIDPGYIELMNPFTENNPPTFIEATGGNPQNSATMIRGFIEAPQTGNYTFWVTGLDDAEFWLSPTASPAGKALEAYTDGATGDNAWASRLTQKSRTIALEKGKQYFFELIQKSAGANGASQLGWWLPDYTLQRPIPIRYAQRFAFEADCSSGNGCIGSFITEKVVDPPQFDRNPGNNSGSFDTVIYLTENQPYDLTPWLTANYPVTNQWQQMNGYVPFGGSQGTPADIAGLTTAANYIEKVTIADHDQKAFRLKVTPQSGTAAFSKVAYISVSQDFDAPTIVSAAASGNTTGFNVTYSEDVDPTTATNKANYSVNNSVVIDHVEMRYGETPNNVVVVYTTGTIPGNSEVTVNNVRDLSTVDVGGTLGNKIASNSKADILLTDGIISARFYGQYNGGSGIGGVNISDLVAQTNRFPDNPDLATTVTSMHIPVNVSDNYGAQLIGFLIPPQTGSYNFAFASDDQGICYLGEDSTAASKRAIAMDPVWNGAANYLGTDRRTRAANTGFVDANLPGVDPNAILNQSKNAVGDVNLVKGNKYYIEALMKENGGGDNLDVTWQLPGTWSFGNNNGLADQQASIPGTYLSLFAAPGQSGPVNITQQPADSNTTENEPVTLSILHGGSPAFSYQWYKNGVILPDANTRELTIPLPDPATDDGAEYHVVLRNLFSETTSSNATLTVVTDTTKPSLVRAIGSSSYNTVTIWFDEVVDPATAGNSANYKIVETGTATQLQVLGSGAFSGPAPGGNTRVTFSTGLQTAGKNYTVTVNNVKDIANAQNVIETDSTVKFTGWIESKGFVLYRRYDGTSGGSIAGLNANPIYPNNPSFTEYKTEWHQAQTADPNLDNYGGVFTGYFYPDQTGRYNFYFSGDDNGALYLSPDTNPASKIQIASEPGWRGEYEWTGVGSGGTANGVNNTLSSSDSVLNLTTGQRRYMELIQVEGGGGDTSAATFSEPGEGAPANGTVSRMRGKYISALANPDETTFTFSQNLESSITIGEGNSVQLSVDGSGQTLDNKLNSTAATIFWQWQRQAPGASTWTDIDGANGTSYTTPVLFPADDQVKYRALGSIPGLTSSSVEATITVVIDGDGPVITAITGNPPAAIDGTQTKMRVYFDEAVNKTEAETLANYSIVDGASAPLTISGVSLSSNRRVATLTTAAQTPGTAYTVTVSGIHDTVTTPNILNPNPTVKTVTGWTLGIGAVHRQLYYDIGGDENTLTNDVKYPNSPDLDEYTGAWEQPGLPRDNFGTRMTGLIVPTETAEYYFAISGDDHQLFFLSTDDNPANKYLVVAEPNWNNFRDWNTTDRRIGDNPYFPGVTSLPINNSTNTVKGITLTAGVKYYAESIGKEGGGGDSSAVTWWKLGQTVPANGGGSISGTVVQNYVNPDNAITITQQPANQTVDAGTDATFTVAATTYEPAFGGPIRYQWRKGGTPISGATGSSYTVSAVDGTKTGTFDVVLTAPGAPNATSASATLSVNTVVTPPTLAITKNGNNVVVTYPTADHDSGNALEKATDLSDPLTFNADDTGADVSGTWTTTVDVTAGGANDQSYWRTKK